MARALNFSIEGNQYSLSINKLDRKKLYGFTQVEVKDEDGNKCELATISDDGKHILPKGSVGYVYMNAKNEYVPSSSMKMVDKDGNPIEKILSSFDSGKIKLERATIEDYLQMYVKAVYQLTPEGNETDLSGLLESLKKNKVLYFKFNYRTDYDNDDAFLLESEGHIFMVIGHISPFEFVGLEKTVDDLVADDDDDDFDFGML